MPALAHWLFQVAHSSSHYCQEVFRYARGESWAKTLVDFNISISGQSWWLSTKCDDMRQLSQVTRLFLKGAHNWCYIGINKTFLSQLFCLGWKLNLTFSGHHGREVEGGSCRGSILFPPLIDLLGFCRIREIVQECFYRQNNSVRLLIRILLKRKELLHFLEISSDDINDISLVILDW